MKKILCSISMVMLLAGILSTVALAAAIEGASLYTVSVPKEFTELDLSGTVVQGMGKVEAHPSGTKVYSQSKTSLSSPYVVVSSEDSRSLSESLTRWEFDISNKNLYKGLTTGKATTMVVDNYNVDFVSGKATSNIRFVGDEKQALPMRAIVLSNFNGSKMVQVAVIYNQEDITKAGEVYRTLYESFKFTEVKPGTIVDSSNLQFTQKEQVVAVTNPWLDFKNSWVILVVGVGCYLIGVIQRSKFFRITAIRKKSTTNTNVSS
jgi:hypothetical protein